MNSAKGKDLAFLTGCRLPAVFLGFSLWVSSWMLAAGASGILIWKQQAFHDDATANAVIYSRSQVLGPVTQFSVGGKSLSFKAGQFFRYVEFSSGQMQKFTDETDYLQMQQQYEELSALSNQYAKAAPLLATRLERMRDILKGYDEGKVYDEGRWMPREEYLEAVKVETKANETQRQKENQAEDTKRKIQLGGIAGFLLVLLTFSAMRKWRWVGLLLLIPLAGAGWLTYQEDGYDWSHRIPEFLELPSDWQALKDKYLKDFKLSE